MGVGLPQPVPGPSTHLLALRICKARAESLDCSSLHSRPPERCPADCRGAGPLIAALTVALTAALTAALTVALTATLTVALTVAVSH